jgi:hypothetical protein
MYALGRALRFDALTSAIAALLFASMPNVWFYGGTSLSDIGGVVTILAGAAALLYGRGSDRAWCAGSILLGLSLAFRPQNALLALYPWCAAAWPRLRARRFANVIAGIACTIAIVAVFYGGAIAATGWYDYRDALRAHSDYLLRVDSYRNPGRQPVPSLLYPMLVNPYDAGKIAVAIGALALIGLLRARRPALEAVAMFAPFAIFMLALLDPNSISRYSIAYVPLLALLAAEGIRVVASIARRPAFGVALRCAAAAVLLAALIRFTAPALRGARKHDAPPVEAVRWIRKNLDPRATRLYVHGSMKPFVECLLSDRTWIDVGDRFSGLDLEDSRDAWLLREGPATAPDAHQFERPHDHLWNIARRRYFEVSVEPLAELPRFGDGWHDPEGEGSDVYRWMKPDAAVELPPVTGRAELSVEWEVPLAAEPRPPIVTFTLNGQPLDRVTCTAPAMRRKWIIDGAPRRPNTLRINVDEFVNPAKMHRGGDTRDLALRLNHLFWKPLP